MSFVRLTTTSLMTLCLVAACQRAKPTEGVSVDWSAPFGKSCTATTDCQTGQECVEHREMGDRVVNHTCETPCDIKKEPLHLCPSSSVCVGYDHGPQSSIGGICRPTH
jgi:hypothetical protein